MKTLNVKFGKRSYRILIKAGLCKAVGSYVKDMGVGSIAVITDKNVWNIYGGMFKEAMDASSIGFYCIILQPGEQSKTLDSLERIYAALSVAKMKRDGLIIAFGGGVVGDVAGFAAATWNRGIRYIQIPTTLLAQVDSSIGGKTAVNLPEGKNLVGAFYQPGLVLIDTELLSTLPQREFRCGMAEVIKYAAIRSKTLFGRLEHWAAVGSQGRVGAVSGADAVVSGRDGAASGADAVMSGRDGAVSGADAVVSGRVGAMSDAIGEISSQGEVLSGIIYECCRIKKEIVIRDEFDKGERMLLNFGHTFGHAIEKQGNYGIYNHGEAIAKGMTIVATLGKKAGLTASGTVGRLRRLLEAYGLDTETPDPVTLLTDVESDKKNDDSGIWLALIREIGDAFIKHFSFQELRDFVE